MSRSDSARKDLNMLRSIKRLVWLIALLLVAVAILLLILQNPQHSQFRFLFWVTPELPFSIFLILAFVLGLAGALMLSLWKSRPRVFKASDKMS
jgi:uncharacterized integral membrane protein